MSKAYYRVVTLTLTVFLLQATVLQEEKRLGTNLYLNLQTETVFLSLSLSFIPFAGTCSHIDVYQSGIDGWHDRWLRALPQSAIDWWGGGGAGTARRLSLAAPVLSPRSCLPPRLFISRCLIVNDDTPKCSDRKLLITGVVCHLRCALNPRCVCALTR